MARDCVAQEVLGELDSLGIQGRIKEGRKHYKILFEVRGRKLMYTCSKSQSDRRASKNARADIRRMVRMIHNAK